MHAGIKCFLRTVVITWCISAVKITLCRCAPLDFAGDSFSVETEVGMSVEASVISSVKSSVISSVTSSGPWLQKKMVSFSKS